MTVAGRLGAALVVPAVGLLCYPFLPDDGTRDLGYLAIAAAALLGAAGGLRAHGPVRRRAWVLVLGGFALWVLGDAASLYETEIVKVDFYPVPSDAVYLLGYVTLGLGIVEMVRSRRSARDRSVLLDAGIIAIAVGELVGVFLIGPIAADSTLTTAGKVVSSAYPVADVLLLSILLRLWATPGGATTSFRLLCTALSVSLCGDIAWNVTSVTSGELGSGIWNDLLWLGSYVALAAAAVVPSMRGLAERPPEKDLEVAHSRRRLVLLAGALTLPALTLLLAPTDEIAAARLGVGLGFLLLAPLILGSMGTLVATVQAQAVQLSALARADALTGAPNRRTWDHELSRACHASRQNGTPLWVALIDLDHFKAFNDTHGHQAGDLLLREAVARWSHALREGALLARYGGEEFAVLLPGCSAADAFDEIEALRPLTPSHQSFSAGLALWDPASDPGTAVARADAALYEAKRSGRDRVVVARDSLGERAGGPSIVLQPMVDLTTGDQVGVEALSRFRGMSPLQAFEQARAAGSGPELEARAIRAALAHRQPGRLLSVNVSLEALVAAPVLEALPADLHGVMFEITEHSDGAKRSQVGQVVSELRARGAKFAVDDWGQGYSNIDRLIDLRPDMVKLDISLIRNLHQSYNQAIVRAVARWAAESGIELCAEGVETDEQLRLLGVLGVRTGQGFLLARPEAPTTEGVPAVSDRT